MFRQKTDIVDSWDSVRDMIEFFGNDSDNFSSVAGPGAWNDPDQVITIHLPTLRDYLNLQRKKMSIRVYDTYD